MVTLEQENEGLLDEIVEPVPDELAQPSETQGGEISQEAVLAQIDTYLNRLFQPNEIFPWKGVLFTVVGIRGGIVGLAVKSIRTPPKARANHGKRPSRRNQKKYPPKTLRPNKPKEHPVIEGSIETFEAK